MQLIEHRVGGLGVLVLQVDQLDFESRMPACAIRAPLGHRQTNATFTNAGNHDPQLEHVAARLLHP